MVEDCIHDATDVVVLISADTDLIPPLLLVKKEFSKIKIRVCFPPSRYSHDIANTLSAWGKKPVIMQKNYRRFENAAMPDCVAGKISIPAEWKKKRTSKKSDEQEGSK